MEQEIRVIQDGISLEELTKIAKEKFGDLVKAVVDVEQGIMAVGGGLHADEEALLMEQEGSKRENTWGINLYPGNPERDFVEFDSMINLKPSFGNRSRGVDNQEMREKILEIIRKLVQK